MRTRPTPLGAECAPDMIGNKGTPQDEHDAPRYDALAPQRAHNHRLQTAWPEEPSEKAHQSAPRACPHTSDIPTSQSHKSSRFAHLFSRRHRPSFRGCPNRRSHPESEGLIAPTITEGEIISARAWPTDCTRQQMAHPERNEIRHLLLERLSHARAPPIS